MGGTGAFQLVGHFNAPFWFADQLIFSSEEGLERERVMARLPGNQYMPGYNTVLGDPEPFFNFFNGKNTREAIYKDVPYQVEPSLSNAQLAHGDKVRAYKKAQGDKDWWKAGYDHYEH